VSRKRVGRETDPQRQRPCSKDGGLGQDARQAKMAVQWLTVDEDRVRARGGQVQLIDGGVDGGRSRRDGDGDGGEWGGWC
jgi:hypothetical protein